MSVADGEMPTRTKGYAAQKKRVLHVFSSIKNMFKKLNFLKMNIFNYALILLYLLKRKSEQKDLATTLL